MKDLPPERGSARQTGSRSLWRLSIEHLELRALLKLFAGAGAVAVCGLSLQRAEAATGLSGGEAATAQNSGKTLSGTDWIASGSGREEATESAFEPTQYWRW